MPMVARRKPKPIQEPSSKMVAEQERIARHEALFAAIPDGDAKLALIEAMLQRAYDLLWDGDGEACDAITEWLPLDRVREMLDAWVDDQFAKDDGPTSRWH